jgi:hypothetical protein
MIFEHGEAVAAVVSGVACLALLWLSTHFVRRAECAEAKRETRIMHDGQEERIVSLDAALALLKQHLDAFPTAKDMTDIKVAIAHMDGRIDAMQKQMDGQNEAIKAQVGGLGEILKIVRHQSERMNAYLTEHGHD